jgi:hypothetical protein
MHTHELQLLILLQALLAVCRSKQLLAMCCADLHEHSPNVLYILNLLLLEWVY